MPTPIMDLMQVIMGTNDSDYGTVMVPTVKLMGISECTLTPLHMASFLDEIKASVHPGYIVAIPHVSGKAKLSGVVLYDDFPYWLDAAMGTAVPTVDTETTRNYTASANWADSDPQPKIFTIAYGDTSRFAGMPGSVLQTLSVKGESGGILSFDAEFIGKEVASSDVSSSDFDGLTLLDRSVTPVLGAHGALFIDVSSDPVGTTPRSATAFSFELTLDSKRENVTHLGSLVPQGYRFAKWDATLKLSVELTSDMLDIFNAVLDPTVTQIGAERLIRLRFSDTAAAAASDLLLQFDFSGVLLEKPEAFTDKDGVVTIDLMFKSIYNASLGTWFKASSRNLISALA